MNINNNSEIKNSINNLAQEIENWQTISQLKENQIIDIQKKYLWGVFRNDNSETPMKLISTYPEIAPLETIKKETEWKFFGRRSSNNESPLEKSLNPDSAQSVLVDKIINTGIKLLSDERTNTIKYVETLQSALEKDPLLRDEIVDLAIDTLAKLNESMLNAIRGYDQLKNTYSTHFKLSSSSITQIGDLIEGEKGTVKNAISKFLEDAITHLTQNKPNQTPLRRMLLSDDPGYQLTTETSPDGKINIEMPKDFWADFPRAAYVCICDQLILAKRSSFIDYYSLLKLPISASKDEITKALSEIEKTPELKQAHLRAASILSDHDKKLTYDFVLSQQNELSDPFIAYQRLLNQFQLSLGHENSRMALQKMGRFMHQGIIADMYIKAVDMIKQINNNDELRLIAYSSIGWNISFMENKIILESTLSLKTSDFRYTKEEEKGKKAGIGINRTIVIPIDELLDENIKSNELILPNLRVKDTYVPLSDVSSFTSDHLDQIYLK